MQLRVGAVLSLLVLWFVGFGFGCKSIGGRGALSDTLAAPSSVIFYHFGSHSELSQLTAERVQQGWNQVGSVKNGPGGEYRKGFYVATHPAMAERYADPASPWLVTVVLDNECLDSHVDLTQLPRLTGCNDADYTKLDGVDSLCDAVTTRFLQDKKVKLVTDSLHPGSDFFYVRDPSCIRQVDSTANATLSVFADVEGMWRKKPHPRLAERSGKNPVFTNILRQAFLQTSEFDLQTNDRIAKNVASCDLEPGVCVWGQYLAFSAVAFAESGSGAAGFRSTFSAPYQPAVLSALHQKVEPVGRRYGVQLGRIVLAKAGEGVQAGPRSDETDRAPGLSCRCQTQDRCQPVTGSGIAIGISSRQDVCQESIRNVANGLVCWFGPKQKYNTLYAGAFEIATGKELSPQASFLSYLTCFDAIKAAADGSICVEEQFGIVLKKDIKSGRVLGRYNTFRSCFGERAEYELVPKAA
jgi:hypothetical protein